ncbi:hypothetical protein [Grimontia sp. NTOU-MAR1]|uniref:hypothetical protein n=1 Tax=Grimontia sp. NTOU-MAR1 TaxID=3111011 RepID=UPI002DBF29F2|nr:hypothetical protein [Grimontia sp. NTOU-MAR1]WRV98465.1 hypothetical protein VP504_03240 [Grimontia sp. NTOU-MAR1]
MTGYLDSTEKHNSHVVSFDYTQFLCESSRQHWTFLEAITSQLSRFRRRQVESYQGFLPSEAFTLSVSHSLSSLYSDVSNLVTLVEEAKKQHIEALNVFLPYALDDVELDNIRRKTGAMIIQHEGERDFLQVNL